MLVFFAFAALALFWVGMIGFVKRERGWVGITDARRAMLRLIGGVHLLNVALANALLPALRKATKAMIEFKETVERARG